MTEQISDIHWTGIFWLKDKWDQPPLSSDDPDVEVTLLVPLCPFDSEAAWAKFMEVMETSDEGIIDHFLGDNGPYDADRHCPCQYHAARRREQCAYL